MGWRPANLMEQAEAAAYQDQWRPGEPGFAFADGLVWWRGEYPVERLDAPDAAWFAREQAMWAEEGDPERFESMLVEPIREPVIVYDDGNRGYLWDGNHRAAAARIVGHRAVPAIVGVRWADCAQLHRVLGIPSISLDTRNR